MQIRKNNEDQGNTLRVLMGKNGKNRKVIPYSRSLLRKKQDEQNEFKILAVTSGKGGVGKTNVVANLAYGLAKRDKRVMVLDADAGLANMDVLLGLSPRYHLGHVFSGQKNLRDIIVEGPAGINIIPAGSGIQELAHLSSEQHFSMMSELRSFYNDADILIIDTGAGISENVTYFSLMADEIIVLTTSEPTSITDAYALMKVLSIKYGENSFKLLVNAVKNAREADNVYMSLSAAAKNFLNLSIDYLGYVLQDENLPAAVRKQRILMELCPNSRASMCFEKLAGIIDSAPKKFSGNKYLNNKNIMMREDINWMGES